MKKAILLQTIMLLFVAAVAQPYMSCLGKVSTVQKTLETAIGLPHTITNDYNHTLVIDGVERPALREDTITGKLWRILPFGSQDDAEVLMMDLSLEVGDSIWIGWDEYAKIEEIYYDSKNRKVQRTNKVREICGVPGYCPVIYALSYIEGIGPNIGLKFFAWSGEAFLLCAYKDGVQVYANSELDGMCEYYEAGINEDVETSAVKISNTQTSLQISSNTAISGQLQFIDTQGQICYVVSIPDSQSHTVDISGFAAGVYIVRLLSKSGEELVTQKIVKY